MSGRTMFGTVATRSARLCLVADDLTGALDTAAQFVPVFGPIDVRWHAAPDHGRSIACDTGAREQSGSAAAALLSERLVHAPFDPATLHYAKLDTLLRGHPGEEIAAWLRAGRFDRCIVAPAFPHHGRITRGGVQYRWHDGRWSPVAADLATDLERLGFQVAQRRAGAPAPNGISLWDAETDADLDAIVAAALAEGPSILWCGSSGLAAALARSLGATASRAPALSRPVLGLFGSDQAVTAEQVDACGALALSASDGGPASTSDISKQLAQHGVALFRLALPQGTSRPHAAETIAREFGRIVRAIDPPATLLVAGGETLRAVCAALETDHLELVGQIEPGVPCSVMRGGRFDGVRIVSKSGAFGDRNLLQRLLVPDPHLTTGASA